MILNVNTTLFTIVLNAFVLRGKTEKNFDIASPPGYNASIVQVSTEISKESDPNHLIIKKSWDLALGPLKQVCINI